MDIQYLKVIKHDGSLSEINNLEIGEKLKGNCHLKCTTIDKIENIKGKVYRIKPSKGTEFYIGEKQNIMMKARIPIHHNNIVIYTVRGEYFEKIFANKCEAQRFFYTLKEDTFDVNIEEYMSWNEERKNECSLFCHPLDFPSQEIPLEIDALIEIIGFFITKKYIIKHDLLQFLQIKNICIPEIYKINNHERRNKLLIGLTQYGNDFEHYTELKTRDNLVLAQDIKFLALSLGYMAFIVHNNSNYSVHIYKNRSYCKHKFQIELTNLDNYYIIHQPEHPYISDNCYLLY